MSLEAILQWGLTLVVGAIVYWTKRQDSRADGFDVRLDEIERTMHTQCVSREEFIREGSELKSDYQREQDALTNHLVRIEAKLDRVIEGIKKP